MADWTVDYFGPTLITKAGLKPTKEVLLGKKAIALYFSAHWCPPCRGFTPVLAEFYDQLVEEDATGLEIVFVSSDSDQHSFDEYYGSHPWVAVPFSQSPIAQALGQRFGIRGIPALIVLNGADGSVKDRDGRTTVVSAKGDTSKAIAKWQ